MLNLDYHPLMLVEKIPVTFSGTYTLSLNRIAEDQKELFWSFFTFFFILCD